MLKEFRTQRIIWDTANARLFEPIQAVEGDQQGRRLEVQLINKGEVVDLSGTSLVLAWKTRDELNKGLEGFEVVDSEKGIFGLYYPTGMLAHKGRLTASLVFYDDNGRIESREFQVFVQPSVIDDEAVESSDSFTALTQAIVQINEFDGRIEETNRQLAQTERVKIGGGVKGSLSDFDEETLNFIHDGTGGPIEIGSRPEDYSVGPKQTTFIKVSSNLLNVNEREDGYRTNVSDGSLESHVQFAVSDFIPVEKGAQYTMYGAERYSLYDSSKSHISSDSWNYPTDIKTITTTDETRFIRVSFRQEAHNSVYTEVRLNEGDELLPYEPVYKPILDKDKVEIDQPMPVIDYDLLSNDLKDFYDSFAITNLLENGNFSNGLSGWTVNAGSPTVESGMLNVSGTGSNQLRHRFGDTTGLSGHTFYISAKANCTRYVKGTLGVQLLWRDYEGKTIGLTQPSNGETIISDIFTHPTSHPFEIYVGSMLQANLDGVIGDVIFIDLTATFGIGKEPSKQICDSIFGGEYFEDTKRFGLLESHISLARAVSNPEEVEVSPTDAKAAFVSKMNERAGEIGMTNSYFVNADGTPTSSHISTSLDLLKMGIQATGYPELMRVWNKKQYDVLVQGVNPRSLTINTTVSDSALDNHYFVIGGKTGSWLGGVYKTDNVLVIAESDNEWYIASVLEANENRFKVAKELIDIARGESVLSDVNAEKVSVAKVPKHNPFPYEGKDISLDFSKNENQSGYPASVTKVLTALVTLDVVKDLNQRFEIKSSDITSGSGPSLSGGDIITFKDALYLLMLPSSNTTATALSRVVGEMIVRNNLKMIS